MSDDLIVQKQIGGPSARNLTAYLSRATRKLMIAETPEERFKWRLIKNTIGAMLDDLRIPAPELVFVEKSDSSQQR